MSNKISFLFVANERFIKIAKAIGSITSKVKRKFGGLNKQLKKTDKQFKKTSSTFTSGFKRMFVAAAAFFGAREFLTLGAKFQDSLAELSAITGAVGKDLVKLRENIFKLGKGASTSAVETTEAFKLVASAKPELLENLDALTATTKQVLLLKNASGLELAPAANITAQGLNIFGKGAEFAAKFVNILAAGAKLGSSEIADTGAAMLIAGPAARAAGLSFLSLNAALQTTAIGGIKGTQAGTALNAIFGRLRRQGKDFEKLGLQGVFEGINKELNAVTDSTARAKLEAKLFGEEHSKVGLALAANFRHLGKFERVLKNTNIAQEQADIRLGTFSAKMRKLGTILSEKLIKVFLRLEPVLSKQAEDFGKFIDKIDPQSILVFSDALKILVQALVLVAKFGMVVLSIFKGIGTGIGEMAAQITTLNFSAGLETSLKDAFSIGGKVLGFIGGDTKTPSVPGKNPQSQATVDVNLRAPAGIIQSIKQKTTGRTPGLNVGVNMAEAS